MYTVEIIDSAEFIQTQKIKKYSCFSIILAILPMEEFLSNWKLWANKIDFLNLIVSVLYFPSSYLSKSFLHMTIFLDTVFLHE